MIRTFSGYLHYYYVAVLSKRLHIGLPNACHFINFLIILSDGTLQENLTSVILSIVKNF